jgi:hypothetical protein
MPAQANANVIALQLEKVRDKVPLLYERDDILLTMIQQRGDVEKVSSRNMRLPLQVNPGGKAGSYNADGGDLGRGSGTQYDVAQVSPIFFRFAIEITKLVEYATTGRDRAIERASRDQQSPQIPGHQSHFQADRLHGRRAGTRLGKSRHHRQPDHQRGRRNRRQ